MMLTLVHFVFALAALCICWLSWRFFVRPRLDRFVRDRAELVVAIDRRLRSMPRARGRALFS